jgi:hypothetical protein
MDNKQESKVNENTKVKNGTAAKAASPPKVDGSEIISFRVTGVRQLLINSAAGVRPPAEIHARMKELNALRKKTEADERERDRLTYNVALIGYIDQLGPYVPGYNLWAAIRDAAAIHRFKTAWIRGGQIFEDKLHLEYDGPKTADELYADARYVDARPARVIGGGVIIAVRPIFPKWSFKATALVNDAALSVADAKRAITLAGALTGLGTFRQRFGRFDVEFL